MQLSRQLVLVTGAGRGLGRAIAHAFAREGASVIVNWRRSREAAEALAAELGPAALAVQADVTDLAQVQALVSAAQAHFGRPISTVVNNALADFSFNGDARAKADAIGWQDFSTQFEGSVRGALNTVQAALPGMRAQHFGREVNRALSDVAAHFFLFHRFEPPGLQHFADREVKIRE